MIMGGLDRESYDREYGDLVLLKRLYGYFRPYKRNLALISATLMLTSLAQTVIPLLISKLLDSIEGDPTGRTILTLMGLLLGVSFMAFFTNMTNIELTAKTIGSAVFDLRQDAFRAVIKHDMAFFDEQPTGQIVSRITNDTQDFGQVVQLSTQFLSQALVVLFLLCFLWMRSPFLSCLVIIFAPATIGVALLFRHIARRVARESNRVLAKVNALIQETASGIYVAKSFRAEQTIYDEFKELNLTNYRVNLYRGYVFNSIFPVLNMLIGFATAVIVYAAGLQVISAQFSIGAWYLFIQGVTLFFFPLISLASFWSQFQQGLAGSERVFALIDHESGLKQNACKIIAKPLGRIDFINLSFGYHKDKHVLENFNLHIEPGEKLAIVGHTGAGKSTIAKLIMRTYEFNSGELLIDNHDIRNLDLVEYRKLLAIIPQEVFLWNTSVKENILYGAKGTVKNAEERMHTILESIKALDFIADLERGLSTNVGERGSLLSHGQRQLIAFARVLVQNPTVLILDEATASVDPLTELRIQKAIDLLLEGRTSIVIAHRLSTVKKSDRIIVMQEGRILEEGPHEALLRQEGHYAELYDTYFRHQSLSYIESLAGR